MSMRNPRGFSLIELMIAGALSAIVALSGFIALSKVQQAVADQQRITDLTSAGRLAIEMMARDIRSAGDSLEMLPQHCMTGFNSPGTPHNCAAILDPHPWRMTLTRNSWQAGSDGVLYTSDDLAPTLSFENNPEDVVTYEFAPTGGLKTFAGTHKGYVGQLRRIVNPFGFGGEPRRVAVLADNILLDNRMRVNPASPDENDARYDYNLFMYQVLRTGTESWVGDAALVDRTTKQGSYLLPVVRFFDPTNGTYAPYTSTGPAKPWLPNYGTPSVVGLHQSTTAETGALRSGGTSFDTDLRYILDYNRIRTVRVAFKMVEAKEDPDYIGGVDLDPSKPGTARIVPFETTTELKVFSPQLN